jgi:heme exporter protein B
VFTVLVLLVFNFGGPDWRRTARPRAQRAAGDVHVRGDAALNRAFQLELENQALDGLLLSPVSRSSIYLGKFGANLAFVAVVQAIALPLFALFFNVNVGRVLGPLVAVMVLATVGFVAVGTLFSVMVIRTRFAELLLPVLLLPFSSRR